jgi:6-phosphofructokinase 1
MFFEEMIDPATNRTRIRVVDLSSDTYRVARAYMIRLDKEDFESEETVAALADHARMKPKQFRERYYPVVDGSICKSPPSEAPHPYFDLRPGSSGT